MSIGALIVGKAVLSEFEKIMMKKKFTYEEFKKLQNNYEKLIIKFTKKAFWLGQQGKTEAQFQEWLDGVSAYQEEKEVSSP